MKVYIGKEQFVGGRLTLQGKILVLLTYKSFALWTISNKTKKSTFYYPNTQWMVGGTRKKKKNQYSRNWYCYVSHADIRECYAFSEALKEIFGLYWCCLNEKILWVIISLFLCLFVFFCYYAAYCACFKMFPFETQKSISFGDITKVTLDQELHGWVVFLSTWCFIFK